MTIKLGDSNVLVTNISFITTGELYIATMPYIFYLPTTNDFFLECNEKYDYLISFNRFPPAQMIAIWYKMYNLERHYFFM
jgi:hypothetical protein